MRDIIQEIIEPEYIIARTIFTGTEVRDNVALHCVDGVIKEIIPAEEVPDNAEKFDAGMRLIVPGFVNAHHHSYSSLATGIDAGAADFKDILTHLWWHLDESLDEEMIRISARVAWANSVQQGVTTVFDHHASYSHITGSLNILAEEAERAGIRVCLAFEVSDRHGKGARDAAIAENLSHDLQHPAPRMMGMHASFTLDDDTLQKIAANSFEHLPVHIHCAEDTCDLSYGTPVERLKKYMLLRPYSLLIHGVHLEKDAYQLIADADAFLVHCPESNMHNGVGMLDVLKAQSTGLKVLAGTDGMHSSILRTYAAAYFGVRHLHHRGDVGFENTYSMYTDTQLLPNHFFPQKSGTLEPGMRADVAVLDYYPATPVTTKNIWAHLLYKAPSKAVHATIAGGKCVYAADTLLYEDEDELSFAAQSAAVRLHRAFD
jgi:cytosine/adenosine deaminase-related metal-dependent hydrolase